MNPNTAQATAAKDDLTPEQRADVVELAPDRLYVFGGRIPLDERVSWAWPDVWGSLQPLNGYLLLEGDAALIIDPGPACHGELNARQLETILPAGSPFSIFMTRSEFDTFGALPAIADRFELQHLYAGGYINLLDGYASVTATSGAAEHVPLERVGGGKSVTIAADREVTIVKPSFRMITSYWTFDEATGTLFTSDAFGHGTTPTPRHPRVLREGEPFDPAEVEHYLFAKFWWLEHAGENADRIAADLAEFFESHTVNTIAPSRGYVIHGPEQVRRHYDLLRETLAEVAARATTQQV